MADPHVPQVRAFFAPVGTPLDDPDAWTEAGFLEAEGWVRDDGLTYPVATDQPRKFGPSTVTFTVTDGHPVIDGEVIDTLAALEPPPVLSPPCPMVLIGPTGAIQMGCTLVAGHDGMHAAGNDLYWWVAPSAIGGDHA